MLFEFKLMTTPRRYNLNNSSRPSGSSNNAGGSTTSSPAPASGSNTASSKTVLQSTGSPGVLLGLSGGLLVARMFFFGGTLWLIEIIAISVAAGFVYPKGGKVQKRFATAIIAVALLNLFVPGINPRIKSLRESQLNPPPPTEQSAGQEQVNPSLSPTPTPEVWDSTQFSDRGGIILRRAKGFVVVSPESEICMSDFRDSDGAGFIQRVSLIKAGEEERVFSTRESRCWDISEGEYTYRVGDSVSAEIHEYIKYKGRFPVIRPK